MFAHNIAINAADTPLKLSYKDTVIAQSARALKLHEPPMVPVYYLPRDDIEMSLLESSSHTSTCPIKGSANYFHLIIGDETFENAAWSYEAPNDDVADIKDFIAFSDAVVHIETE